VANKQARSSRLHATVAGSTSTSNSHTFRYYYILRYCLSVSCSSTSELNILHCFRHSNVSRSYFAVTLHCSRLLAGWEAVGPQTFSHSSSPIDFKLSHNVQFKYARVFTYIGTSISGEEVVEPETISNTFYIRDGTGRDGLGRDGIGLSHSNAWPGTANMSLLFIR
jgi:hypothetical protein